MQNRNPYAAPQTNVARSEGGAQVHGEIRIFSPRGRLGRVRYIGYTAGLSFLIVVAVGVAAGAAAVASPDLAVLIGIAGYIAIVALQIVLTIQRAHDMNTSGWLSLIVFVPLAAFVFWFVPGTNGENRYGLQPPPNTIGVVLLACILPFLFTGGILAAIAIPAYQDYTIRAQVSEGLNLAAAPRAAVVDAFERTGAAPLDRLAAGLPRAATETSGRYVESVDVAGGTILVTYGSNANSMISGRTLALQPYVLPDRGVAWRCGEAGPPGGAVPMDGRSIASTDGTDIDPLYLPSACRP